ncbi:VOC family protein [Agrobacterium rosae]|uniref:VOC domain-containing protein n=1 Tax=Agrobacterium rosae TaxID=1972867 RepID=A0AAW9FH40_9HYPH|nr:VOC family protein [Agrobacterium rosae]MDX8304471.1 hypothetical protein [Agrobacterium rosae]
MLARPCLRFVLAGLGLFAMMGPRPQGSAAIQLAFRVPLEAVDRSHQELIAKGVPILREPTDLPKWRHRTLFFRDPEDNIIEIYAEH